MNDDKILELLLTLIEDMSFVKTKLKNIDESKIISRIDTLEAQTREQERIIRSLEKRADDSEKLSRDTMIDTNNTQRNIFISAGLAIFGALVSLFINLL